MYQSLKYMILSFEKYVKWRKIKGHTNNRHVGNKIMLIELIIVLTIFTYGSNFILYLILRTKEKIQGIEKLSIFFGVNMTILLLDGVFLFIGKAISDSGVAVLE